MQIACTGGVDESQMAHDDLEICCQALLDMCQCYRSATRALEVVILLKTEWRKLAARWPDTAGSGRRTRNQEPSLASAQPVTDVSSGERGLSNARGMADEASGPWQVLDWTDLPQDPIFDLSPSDHTEEQSLERMFAWGENLLRAYDLEAVTM
ncbi:hypothetical protein SLS56_009950 [Neofusicoccum ribis]|uniref:Fungal specific transcription factor n=1 Tax=Neofusicoccum ribis TaxID=45134 RepID=A0ABR3SFV0_9PEZI